MQVSLRGFLLRPVETRITEIGGDDDDDVGHLLLARCYNVLHQFRKSVAMCYRH